MPSASALDAVTVDGAGTCLALVDPVDRLRASLAERGVERSPDRVRAAFAAEVAYYLPRSEAGRDELSLAGLRRGAVGVFLDHLGCDLDPTSFVPSFMAAIEFAPVPGAGRALAALRAAGLELACVANWDVSLEDHLRRAGLRHHFTVVVSSAEAGEAKPSPRPFLLALERLGVAPARALHIGDASADREGAAAAGMAFAEVPLATLPARLGLEDVS
jgi:putative hydrolase of the HAD superfamily